MSELEAVPLACNCEEKTGVYVYQTGLKTEYTRATKEGWRKDRNIDKCVAPLVDALNSYGIPTTQCCCGHGTRLGEIFLADNRVLLILPPRSLSGSKFWNRQISNWLLMGQRFKFRDLLKFNFAFLWSRTVDRITDYLYWWSISRTRGFFG